MIRWEFFKNIFPLLKEFYYCEFLEMGAKRNINSLQISARNTQLNKYLVGDGDRSKVKLLDVGCKIPNFVDQLIGYIIFIL